MPRRPDHPALKEAKGNPGKRRATAPAEIATAPGAVKPPAKLPPAAASVWRSLAPELERLKFLRPTDAQAFARYCDAVARFWDVSQKLRKAGVTYVTESVHGTMQRIHPLFVVEERLSKRLVELEDRFGLSPAMRQQIMLRLAQGQPSLPIDRPAEAPGADVPAVPEPPALDNPIGLLGTATRH